jgi:hypothetical protein
MPNHTMNYDVDCMHWGRREVQQDEHIAMTMNSPPATRRVETVS